MGKNKLRARNSNRAERRRNQFGTAKNVTIISFGKKPEPEPRTTGRKPTEKPRPTVAKETPKAAPVQDRARPIREDKLHQARELEKEGDRIMRIEIDPKDSLAPYNANEERLGDAIRAYSSALKLVRRKDPEWASRLYEKVGDGHMALYKKENSNRNHIREYEDYAFHKYPEYNYYAFNSYLKAAKKTSDPKRKAELYVKCAKISFYLNENMRHYIKGASFLRGQERVEFLQRARQEFLKDGEWRKKNNFSSWEQPFENADKIQRILDRLENPTMWNRFILRVRHGIRV